MKVRFTIESSYLRAPVSVAANIASYIKMLCGGCDIEVEKEDGTWNEKQSL